MAHREFDIIIFGATGYTGRYVIEELTISVRSTNLRWAIAGRNIQKLKDSLDIVQGYLANSDDIRDTTLIYADVDDPASISNMCKKAKLILNCVGPYMLYGEAVVSACIENGTHHVDISAEIQYLETIQAKYFNAAKEKGVYIAEACGFASIPSDYGTSLLKKEFPGDINSVEYFVEIGTGPEGRTTNIGTYNSGVHSLGDLLHTKKYEDMLKEEVFKKDLVESSHTLYKKFPPLFYSGQVKGWCLWFLGPDERVIKRSQHFRYEYLNERPIQVNGYIQMYSLLIALSYALFASLFYLLSLCSYGRSLLAKYPSFFTAGTFSKTGPTRKQVLEGATKFTLYGKGWDNKLTNPMEQHVDPPKKEIKLTISAPEPAYAFTSMCMVQAGLTILQEKEKLPLTGGVLTPGVAFEHTSLRNRLEKRGVTFQFEEMN